MPCHLYYADLKSQRPLTLLINVQRVEYTYCTHGRIQDLKNQFPLIHHFFKCGLLNILFQTKVMALVQERFIQCVFVKPISGMGVSNL